MVNWWRRRRVARARRREIGLAIRAEFELERPRGFAAVRSFVWGVGELERARITGRDPGTPEPTVPAAPAQRTTAR
ncbi:MAG TPA: hypothetical protein VFR49_10275 [Solirubrobacteraceae bacterium]|nr:hypothetical protein [Solirubrobacteraceae bacterium]